jgi:aminoglycoside phosphotransferase (APT) family kinase protein
MTETRPVRSGEEIDLESLRQYLEPRLALNGSELTVAQFPAGSSNLTYLINAGGSEYVLRRPPFGNTVRTAHDMRREFDVLSKLSAVYPPAPKSLVFCGDTSVIGSEFYLMERRRGMIIRGTAPQELASSAELQRDVCGSFIRNLAELHRLDYRAAGLGALGKPQDYCRRQVEGWTSRYVAA